MKKLILVIAVLILLSSCTAHNHNIIVNYGETQSGFWMGLWHGIIAPFIFVISWFSDSVTVWEVNNNGGWYTFGFLLGVGAFTSTASSSIK